jgi:hypothetical protein
MRPRGEPDLDVEHLDRMISLARERRGAKLR